MSSTIICVRPLSRNLGPKFDVHIRRAILIIGTTDLSNLAPTQQSPDGHSLPQRLHNIGVADQEPARLGDKTFKIELIAEKRTHREKAHRSTNSLRGPEANHQDSSAWWSMAKVVVPSGHHEKRNHANDLGPHAQPPIGAGSKSMEPQETLSARLPHVDPTGTRVVTRHWFQYPRQVTASQVWSTT
jgi:hypothetical protein